MGRRAGKVPGDPMRCETCIYWAKLPNPPNRGICRANPPTPVNSLGSSWPVVMNLDWCGQHKEKSVNEEVEE